MRRVRRTSGPGGLIVVLALLVAGIASPAQAERWHGSDGDNPSMPNGDISRVQVDHAPRNLFTKVRFHDWGPGWRLRVHIDTLGRDKGPEFVLDSYIIAEAGLVDRWHLRRIDTFRQGQRGKGTVIRCRGDRVSLTADLAAFTRVPRGCLTIDRQPPERVRVSVYSWAYNYGSYGPRRTWFDWAPAQQRFGPWVSR